MRVIMQALSSMNILAPNKPMHLTASKAISLAFSEYRCGKCFLSSAEEKLLLLPVSKVLALTPGDRSGPHRARQATAGVVRCRCPVSPHSRARGVPGQLTAQEWAG